MADCVNPLPHTLSAPIPDKTPHLRLQFPDFWTLNSAFFPVIFPRIITSIPVAFLQIWPRIGLSGRNELCEQITTYPTPPALRS